MKAYWVHCGGVPSIVFAATGAKARWCTVRSARDAGYDFNWSSVSSAREPECDQYYKPGREGKCWSLEYLLDLEKAERPVNV